VLGIAERVRRVNPDAWIIDFTADEDLALDAALRGSRDRVFKALLAHPLVGRYDRAEALTDRPIAHSRGHLAWV
jgi:6-phospho-beta-glucosidase